MRLPSFLGYHGYPATLCVSVNDEVVHGIPGPRVLEPGDVVSIDCGAIVDGWHGDSAITVVLDGADPEDVDLAATTERAHVGRASPPSPAPSASVPWGRPSRTSSTPPRRPA